MCRTNLKYILFFCLICQISNENPSKNATINDQESVQISNRFLNFDGLTSSVTYILEIKKNIIAGWPLELISNAIDQLCTSTLFMQFVPASIIPDIKAMHFKYITPCKNYSTSLLDPEELWSDDRFNKKKKVVMLATGWTNTVNNSGTLEMLSEAFLCRKEVNFIIVDVGRYVDTLYNWAAINSEEIGKYIGIGLTHLVKVVPLENIHLIGHSLGAHVMGSAARYFTKLTGLLIPRVTGLDPAKPCFRHNRTLNSLQRGDAEFVDIIHSNNGILAKSEAMGDVDFYPGGANPLPPGCFDITCAHSRAVEYFAESVYPGNEKNFKAQKCASWNSLKTLDCEEKQTTIMGYRVNKLAKGLYYVDVNRESPFGKNAKLYINIWQNSTCNVCKTIKKSMINKNN